MRDRTKEQGFTFWEVTIVVVIIVLLARIAISNILHARLSADDALARSALRAMSTAEEFYSSVNNGNYPANEGSLTAAVPPYLKTSYCANSPIAGYFYNCSRMSTTGYTITATPVVSGTTGSTTQTVSTGCLLTP